MSWSLKIFPFQSSVCTTLGWSQCTDQNLLLLVGLNVQQGDGGTRRV